MGRNPRRSREDVIQAALELLDEQGIENVTLRGVAKRLDAHLNTVSFQVKTKSQLLELMADAILGSAYPRELPEEPASRVRALARGLRQAMLSRRDGAKLVAGTESFHTNTLRMAESLASAVRELGADDTTSIRALWNIQYLVLGLAQEEQAAGTHPSPSADDFPALDYPTLYRLGDRLVSETFDEQLNFGLEAILAAVVSNT